jgi:serine/threonine-protein kinase
MPTATDLLQSLRDAALLDAEQVKAVVGTFGGDVSALVDDLVRRGWLTAFQAERVLQNEAGHLQIGQYLLLDILGEGGMGRVYKALHRRLNRLVALKTIREECLSKDPDATSRFEREARAAAALQHPNIVTLYDFDAINGVQFLAMEFIQGPELGRVVKKHGPLPVDVAAECIRQTAAGLQHAFEHGMVHRDLKPSNLLAMDPDITKRTGRMVVRAVQEDAASDPLPERFVIKILDMGLVRMIDPKGERQSNLTREGELFGTPDYIAPEQARDARKADIRSDLYSLGCTLYFLLTGKAPFKGENVMDVLLAHQLDEAPPVESLRPDVTAHLAAVTRRLMAKKPEDRYQTPAELVNALAPGSFTPGGVRTDAPLSDIVEVVRPAKVSVSSPTPLPHTIAPAAEPTKKIGEFLAHKGPVLALDFTPDRKTLASGSSDGSVRVWSMTRSSPGEETLPIPSRAEVRSVAFSLDRRLLAAAADAAAGAIWLWDRCAATSRPMVSLHGHQSPVECLAFAPGGKILASAGNDRTVRLWEVDTPSPRELSTLEGHAAPIHVLSFSIDGRLLVSGGSDGALHLWGFGKRSYEARATLECHAGRIASVRLSGDGRVLATGGNDHRVKLWDIRSGVPQRQPLHSLVGHQSAVRGVHFSPDDRHLVSVDADGLVILWEVSSGRRVFDWRISQSSTAAAHAFTYDGRYIAVGLSDGSIVVHRIPFREMNL